MTGGKSMKTGFVMARAQLAAKSSTGVVAAPRAAQESQTAMAGKGKCREEEKVAQELPVGSLATNEMRCGRARRRSSRRRCRSGCAPRWLSRCGAAAAFAHCEKSAAKEYGLGLGSHLSRSCTTSENQWSP